MPKLLILGGTGFVGRALTAAWCATPAGLLGGVRVPSRRPERAKALAVWPGAEVVRADVLDPAQLASLLVGCDAVVNLVAVLHGDAARFEQVHVTLPQQLARACVQAGVRRVIHVSALGVPDAGAPAAPSDYLRSKARGEAVLQAQAATGAIDLTLLRPSVIFGTDDRFINLFAGLQALAPLMPLAGAGARFQPVWVGDVAQAVVRCLGPDGAATVGQVIECAGPQVLTLAELVRAAGRWSGHVRPVLPLPEWAGRVQAAVLGLLPGEPLMSADNLRSMRVPNVASGRHPGLASLGIRPASLTEVMAPWLAGGFSRNDQLRTGAGR